MPQAYNSLAALQQEGQPRKLRARKPKQPKTILSQVEEESALKQFGKTVVSGVGRIGNLLDIPGSMVRDMSTGNNPLDQLLSPTTSENRVTGREMLTKWGVTSPNDPKRWEGADFGGFAAEIALDPLSYLTLGASAVGKLGKVGQIAAKSGALKALPKLARAKGAGTRVTALKSTLGELLREAGPEAAQRATNAATAKGLRLADYLDKPLRTAFGLRVPFTDIGVGFGKAGGLGEKWLAGLDVAGRVSSTNPLSRAIKSGFFRATSGTRTELGQQFSREGFEKYRSANVVARSAIADDVRSLAQSSDIGKADPVTRMANLRAFGRYLEQAGKETRPGVVDLPDHLKQYQSMLDRWITEKNRIWSEVGDLGAPAPILEDAFIRHFPRELHRFAKSGIPRSMRGKAVDVFKTTSPHQFARNEFLKHHPGGTDFLQDLSLDQEISGLAYKFRDAKLTPEALESVRRTIRQKYVGLGLGPMDDIEADQLAQWIAHLDPQHAQKGVPAFVVNPLKPLLSYLEHAHGMKAGINTAYDFIGNVADMAASPGSRTIASVLRDLSIDVEKAAPHLVSRLEKNSTVTEGIKAAFRGQQARLSPEALEYIHVPKQYADDVTRYLRSFEAPEEIQPALALWDKFLNAFRFGVTAFPAYWSRNALSGWFQNAVVGGIHDPFTLGPWKYIQPVVNAENLMKGRAVKNASKIPEYSHLSDKEATEKIAQELFAQDLGVGRGSYTSELPTDFGADLSQQMPGLHPAESVGQIARGSVPRSLAEANLLNIRNVGSQETISSLGKTNEKINSRVEGWNRYAPYIALRMSGWAPEAAAERVSLLQVDYNNLSRMEQQVARRLFPFYSFTRHMVPFVMRELIDNPGGRLGATIRAQRLAATDEEEPGLPPYVASRGPVPLGVGPGGASRYLTGLGLMHEDPLEFASGNAGLEALSRLNPLVKAPLELAFGESTFQRGASGGRDLTDLDPTIGRTLANVTGREYPYNTRSLDFLIGNSPLARLATSARTAADTRKSVGERAMNLLTGLRTTTVSPDARDKALMDEIKESMKATGGRTFEDVYFRKGQDLTPEQEHLLALMGILKKRQRERRKTAEKPKR